MTFDHQVEDMALVASVQAGLDSGAVPQGRVMVESEQLIADFHRRGPRLYGIGAGYPALCGLVECGRERRPGVLVTGGPCVGTRSSTGSSSSGSSVLATSARLTSSGSQSRADAVRLAHAAEQDVAADERTLRREPEHHLVVPTSGECLHSAGQPVTRCERRVDVDAEKPPTPCAAPTTPFVFGAGSALHNSVGAAPVVVQRTITSTPVRPATAPSSAFQKRRASPRAGGASGSTRTSSDPASSTTHATSFFQSGWNAVQRCSPGASPSDPGSTVSTQTPVSRVRNPEDAMCEERDDRSYRLHDEGRLGPLVP